MMLTAKVMIYHSEFARKTKKSLISSAKFRIFIPVMINEKRYKKLKEKYTDEEIAESFFIPADLTAEQRKAADEEMWAFRKKQLQNRTPQQKIYAGLLQICYQMKAYIESSLLDDEQSVATYLRVTSKNQKQLSEDLSIHKTRLSRILNERERLTLALAYRLERHSGNLIPAIYWWKLAQKEIEQNIHTNTKERLKEANMVKNIVYQETA